MSRGDFMKYTIHEHGDRIFYGLSETCDLKTVININFAPLWDKTAKMFDMSYFTDKYFPIGLESYPEDFMEERIFTYSALMPVHKTEGLDPKLIKVVKGGKFIRFETTFGGLFQGFVPQVYAFVKENKIPVDYSMDYEEYPPEFDAHDPASPMYVCFRYLGDE